MSDLRWWAALLLTALLPAAAFSADSLVLSAGSVKAAAGKEVAIPISIKGAQDVVTLQVRLAYDRALLEVTRVEGGSSLAKHIQADLTSKPGEALLGLISTDGRARINGDGEIFKVFAQVRGKAGQQTPLTIDPELSRVWNGPSKIPLPMAVQDGTLTITDGSHLWWWLIALVVIAWLVYKARSGRGSGGERLARPLAPASVPPPPPAPAPAAVLPPVAAPAPAIPPPVPPPVVAEEPIADPAPAGEEEIPTYGLPCTFKHHCNSCQQVIELPTSALGKKFKCAGCGAVQVGGQ